MVMLPYSQQDRDRFHELAELYLACRAAFRDISVETQSLPVPGSRAQLDKAALLAREPPIAPSSEQLITWQAQLYLYGASEHLGGLAALYRIEEILLSPLVLARCSIEYSAHTLWIVGDASGHAEDRLARAFLEAIFGAEQAKMQAGRLTDRSGPEHRGRRENYKAVKKDAQATFRTPRASRGRDNCGPQSARRAGSRTASSRRCRRPTRSALRRP
jgi:hypothetical protein